MHISQFNYVTKVGLEVHDIGIENKARNRDFAKLAVIPSL